MCIAKMSAATLKTYQKWTINANFLKPSIKVAHRKEPGIHQEILLNNKVINYELFNKQTYEKEADNGPLRLL